MAPGHHRALALRLEAAWAQRAPIAPLSADGSLAGPEDAYAVQRAWAGLRAAAGERTLGRKIGLTSPGMRAQMQVDEPDYGDLWASRHTRAPGGVATIATAPFLQPRVEGELAFLLGRDLGLAAVDEDEVRAATAAVAPALEVVDSRIADWRIALVDTIADNASYGGFSVGAWVPALLEADLVALPMQVSRNGEVVVDETGAAVMGSPLTAVAWLANKLGGFGIGLRAGDIVLSGSFGRAVDVVAGDEFAIAVPGTGGLVARFV
ncbi:MAG: 2-keto-4-pentenoate hydratase [Baekduia sp.]|nr:2-keto-4-pentenoate hydratase [Baekduia sp.]